MRPGTGLQLVAVLCLVSVPMSVTLATPYWTEEDAARSALQPQLSASMRTPSGTAPRDASEYLAELGRIASFLRTWQVDNPSSPDHGGIREGEHLPNIIQTDNTSEAIWVWTRYYELTGDNTYLPNVLRAFQYSSRYPAHNEEGGSTPNTGYYRMYNCGWAVRAEAKYRDVYGDATYKAYADSCASYLRYHTLNRFGSPFYDNINLHVLAWAMGNLHDYGVHEGNPLWTAHASAEAGAKPKVWIETDPTLLASEAWAMSGGATAWGLIHSYFAEHPGEAAAWLGTYKGYMDTFSSPGDFTNAWNGWYALGHRAIGLTLADPSHLATYIDLTEYLIDEDADVDGGVPARPEDTDQMDQTWVSNYLAFMGLSDGIGPASDVADGAAAGGSQVLRASPNPVRGGRCVVSVQRFPGGQASLTLHDLAGRRVRTVNEVSTGATGSIAWDVSSVPAGVYWVLARGSSGQASTKIQIVR